MTPDLDRIRKTHANALANRERGVIDSRDDDIGVLLGEVERLKARNVLLTRYVHRIYRKMKLAKKQAIDAQCVASGTGWLMRSVYQMVGLMDMRRKGWELP